MARAGSREGSQGELFAEVRRRRARVERAVDASIAVARKANTVTPLQTALVATARALGRALDVAEAKHDPYAVATVARELRAVAADLELLPHAQSRDPFAELLAELGSTEVRDTT